MICNIQYIDSTVYMHIYNIRFSTSPCFFPIEIAGLGLRATFAEDSQ